MSKVLLAGIYLAHRPNTAAHIAYQCASSRDHAVTQRWAAVALGGAGLSDLPGTIARYTEVTPKFTIIDALAADAGDFDWLLISDDDVELPDGFIDCFLALAGQFDFALCQPARTIDSYIDHGLVMQAPGLLARRTRFVEIGPFVAIRRDAMRHLLPFGPEAGMGWGLDFIWPVTMERAGLRLGVIDAAPIAHRMRKPVTGYDHGTESRAMFERMALNPYLPHEEAFTVLEAYA